jgi:hypothetical protein
VAANEARPHTSRGTEPPYQYVGTTATTHIPAYHVQFWTHSPLGNLPSQSPPIPSLR